MMFQRPGGTVGAGIKCVANWVASVMSGVCNGP